MSSTLTSLGRHNLTLPGDELKELLYRACMAAARTPAVGALEPRRHDGRTEKLRCSPATRRCWPPGHRLFRAQGYPAVSTAEIGKGAGIAGPGPVPLVLVQAGHSRRTRSAGSTSGAASNASARCARIGPEAQRLRGLVAARFGSAWTTPTSSPCRSPNCRTPPARFATAITRNQADREGGVDRPRPQAGPADHRCRGASCSSPPRSASSKTSRGHGISPDTPGSAMR